MQDNIYNITIAGSGYVGMSLAVLLSKENNVKVIDIDKNKVNLINQRKSTIVDKDIDKALASYSLNLNATTIAKNAYKNADYIIIATPTDFDEKTNKFNTSSVEDVIEKALKCLVNKRAFIYASRDSCLGSELELACWKRCLLKIWAESKNRSDSKIKKL